VGLGQFSLQFGATRSDLFEQLVGGELAQRSKFFDA
jgi:hypothetical protein